MRCACYEEIEDDATLDTRNFFILRRLRASNEFHLSSVFVLTAIGFRVVN